MQKALEAWFKCGKGCVHHVRGPGFESRVCSRALQLKKKKNAKVLRIVVPSHTM